MNLWTFACRDSEAVLAPGASFEAQPISNSAESGAIVFESDRAETGVRDLYVMRADGSNVRRLTSGGNYSMPVWSPDGQSIAFRQVTGTNAALGLVPTAGGEPVLLVTAQDPEVWDRALGWWGDELFYASHEGGPATDLWVVSRSGGQRRPLFTAAGGRRGDGDVSKVDGRFVFSWQPALPDSSDAAAAVDLWIADGPDDPAPVNLTEGRVFIPRAPRWSPDGTRVVFWGYARLADGSVEGLGAHDMGTNPPDGELYLIDVSTHELSRLTDNDVDDIEPAWTPDGQRLIFSSARDGAAHIWMMSVDAAGDAINLTSDTDASSSDGMADCYWSVGAP